MLEELLVRLGRWTELGQLAGSGAGSTLNTTAADYPQPERGESGMPRTDIVTMPNNGQNELSASASVPSRTGGPENYSEDAVEGSVALIEKTLKGFETNRTELQTISNRISLLKPIGNHRHNCGS